MGSIDTSRPYLVIPKLVEQPTWGGTYIAATKGWADFPELRGKKIGQSYELFSGSNLSLYTSSDDPAFRGEIVDRDTAQFPTHPPHSVPLSQLVALAPERVLGAPVTAERGTAINVLIKFTQALGNSFQVHLKDGQTDPFWKPKPESWYFFEPGIITLGIKKSVRWQDYRAAVESVEAGMRTIGDKIKSGKLSYEQAQQATADLIGQHDPWQFVNTVPVAKNEVVDVSTGGVHHSWEENPESIPLGNVLYELQTEAMDDVSTLRSFDRGKIGRDGSLRDLHIADYFRLIDRSPDANDPNTFLRRPRMLAASDAYELASLLETPYYRLNRLTFTRKGATYETATNQFAHLFVKSGKVKISAASGSVQLGAGHSCFVPAGAKSYGVGNIGPAAEILITQ